VNYWDIGATFLFGDDFLGSTLDTSKWTDITVGGAFSDDIANSILTLECASFPNATTSGEGVRSIATPVTSPVIVQVRYRQPAAVNGPLIRIDDDTFVWSAPVNDVPTIYFRSDNNVYHEDIGGWQDALYIRARDTAWHTTEMWFTGANLKYYEGGSLVGTGDESTAGISADKILLGSWRWTAGGTLEVDWALVRKYASNPPTYQFGAEESAPTAGVRPPRAFYGPFTGPLGGPI